MDSGYLIHLLVYIAVLAVGLGIFARTISRRLKVFALTESHDARGEVPRRLTDVLVHVFGQYRLLHGDMPAGIMHFLIFWGFVVLMVNTAHFLISGFAPQADMHIPLLGREDLLGKPYLLLRDVFTMLVLAAVLFAMYRRLLVKPGG